VIFVSSYPERNFGGNQLLDSSMSLSPLYPDLTSDLHVSTAFERPPRFPLASFGPGKARYLSGPSECALLQIPFTYDQDRALLHGDARLLPPRHRQSHFHYALIGFCHHNTRTFGRLLGPCFKTVGKRPCLWMSLHTSAKSPRSAPPAREPLRKVRTRPPPVGNDASSSSACPRAE